MKERDSRPDMTGLVDQLENEAVGQALGNSDAPESPLTPPGGNADIDPDKLLRAWVVMTDVQKQLVRAIQRTERDNRTTRRHNAVTRAVVLVALVGMVAVIYRAGEENHAQLKEVCARQSTVATNVEATLGAVRAVAGALGAKIEAETAMHPAADEAAREKAVEAQEEALEAEAHVASDPSARASAAAKLVTIRERKRRPRPRQVYVGEEGDREP